MKFVALALLSVAACSVPPPAIKSVHCAGSVGEPVAAPFAFDLTEWASGSTVSSASVNGSGATASGQTVVVQDEGSSWTFEYDPPAAELADPKAGVLLISERTPRVEGGSDLVQFVIEDCR